MPTVKYTQRERARERERAKDEWRKEETSHGREAEHEHRNRGTQEKSAGVSLSTALLTKVTEISSTTAFLQECFLASPHFYSPLPAPLKNKTSHVNL